MDRFTENFYCTRCTEAHRDHLQRSNKAFLAQGDRTRASACRGKAIITYVKDLCPLIRHHALQQQLDTTTLQPKPHLAGVRQPAAEWNQLTTVPHFCVGDSYQHRQAVASQVRLQHHSEAAPRTTDCCTAMNYGEQRKAAELLCSIQQLSVRGVDRYLWYAKRWNRRTVGGHADSKH
jgi:hypothetical protein